METPKENVPNEDEGDFVEELPLDEVTEPDGDDSKVEVKHE